MSAEIITGDCRTDLLQRGPFDLLIADPPYGDTSLEWDKECVGWIPAATLLLKPAGSLWVFGSMRMFQNIGTEIDADMAQAARDRLGSRLPLVAA